MPERKEIIKSFAEDDYYSIAYDPELQVIILTYKRKGSSEEYRNVHHELLRAIREFGVSKVLVNTFKMGVVDPEDQRWLGQHMIPLLAKATPGQFLYSAVVVPDNVFTQLAVHTVESISMETGTCLNRHFKSIADARLWLQEQK